jgi:hypothetical protein
MAAEENQKMLKKEVEPNDRADTAHIRKHLDFVRSNELKPEVTDRILAHMKAEMPYARKNMVERLMVQKASMGALPEMGQGELGEPQGLPDMGQLPDSNLQAPAAQPQGENAPQSMIIQNSLR